MSKLPTMPKGMPIHLLMPDGAEYALTVNGAERIADELTCKVLTMRNKPPQTRGEEEDKMTTPDLKTDDGRV